MSESKREHRYAVMPINRQFLHEWLQLPETTKIINLFIDPWSGEICLTLQDDQFPEHQEGTVMRRIWAVYERREENGMEQKRSFYRYGGLVDAPQ